MNEQYKAKSVEECWQIAFDYAEEMQELLNEIGDKDKKYMEVLRAKRNAASEIAWRIKHGERKEIK